MGSSASLISQRASLCIQEFVGQAAVSDFHDKYLLGPKLGRGAFAEVYTAEHICSEAVPSLKYKAVKIISLEVKREANESQEIELWQSVGHHDNLVALHEVFRTQSLCYIVMEKCLGRLHHCMKVMPDLTERTLGHIFLQMLHSLSHVHAAHVVHRDVKPDNFLVGGEDGKTVKLCDFGLAGRVPEGEKLSEIVGTAPFMCPEMLREAGYDCKADVWSLGVVAYVFLFGVFPYTPTRPNSKLMKAAIVDGIPPEFAPLMGQPFSPRGRTPSPHTHSLRTQFYNGSVLAFVKSLLHRDPEQRTHARDALGMEYMIASANNRHAKTVELPSLMPMLVSAREVGAFAKQDVQKEFRIDKLMNKVQRERHGVPIPVQTPRKESKACNSIYHEWDDSRTEYVQGISSDRKAPSKSSTASTACPSHISRASSKNSTENNNCGSVEKPSLWMFW